MSIKTQKHHHIIDGICFDDIQYDPTFLHQLDEDVLDFEKKLAFYVYEQRDKERL